MFTDPEIAWAGLTEQQAKAESREIEVARYPWAASGRAQSLGRTEGFTKLLIDPETERILGIGIVGTGAGELVAEGVLAIEMGCTARDIAESIHPHPTLSETLSFSGELFLGTATENLPTAANGGKLIGRTERILAPSPGMARRCSANEHAPPGFPWASAR